MTVADAIRAGTARLADTSDTARLDAELLMAHVLGMARSDMLLRAMGEAAPAAAFAALIERRARHEPVAYVLGQQEFYGHSFAVGPGVLIPRPDSETLIEAALERKPDAARVLDLGTGSGALVLTVLAQCARARGMAVDASEAALAMARANAARLGLEDRCELLLRNWHEAGWTDGLGTFDLVLCNPPYVEADAALAPDVRDHEPASALFAGPEGLDDYRALIPQLGKLLAPGGVAVFEIGASQADAVGELAEKAGFEVDLRHDLANRPRAVILS